MRYELIIPSYKRITALQALFESIRSTTPKDRIGDIQAFVVFDNNDKETAEEAKNRNLFHGIKTVTKINYDRQYVFRIWNNHLQYQFNSDVVLTINDDAVFIGRGMEAVMEHWEKRCADTDWIMSLKREGSTHSASFLGQVFREKGIK